MPTVFRGLAPAVAQRLMVGHPGVDPNDYEGNGPSMSYMVALARQNHGLLDGYVVSAFAPKSDPKILFTGIYLPSEEKARSVASVFPPDEMVQIREGEWYLRWGSPPDV